MISGLPANHVMRALLFMHESNIKFFLTGSRFFGNVQHDSDYDFYCQDTEEARNFITTLKDNGFDVYKMETNQYMDLVTTDCFRIMRNHPGIDIAMVMSTKIKGIAREILLKTKTVLPRQRSSDQWELALLAACGSLPPNVLNAELFPYVAAQPDKVANIKNLLLAMKYEDQEELLLDRPNRG